MAGKILYDAEGRPRQAVLAGCASGTAPSWEHVCAVDSKVTLIEDGPRMVRVDGPSHAPYYVLADGRQEPAT